MPTIDPNFQPDIAVQPLSTPSRNRKCAYTFAFSNRILPKIGGSVPKGHRHRPRASTKNSFNRYPIISLLCNAIIEILFFDGKNLMLPDIKNIFFPKGAMSLLNMARYDRKYRLVVNQIIQGQFCCCIQT